MDRSGLRREHGWRENTASHRVARYSLAAPGHALMEYDGWPLDAASAAELVARLIEDIDHSGEEDRDILLSDLLCAAWPNPCSQSQ